MKKPIIDANKKKYGTLKTGFYMAEIQFQDIMLIPLKLCLIIFYVMKTKKHSSKVSLKTSKSPPICIIIISAIIAMMMIIHTKKLPPILKENSKVVSRFHYILY